MSPSFVINPSEELIAGLGSLSITNMGERHTNLVIKIIIQNMCYYIFVICKTILSTYNEGKMFNV